MLNLSSLSLSLSLSPLSSPLLTPLSHTHIQEIEVYAKQTQTDIAVPERRDEEDEEESEIPAEPVRQDTSAKNQHKDDTIEDKPVNPPVHSQLYKIPMM